MSLNASQPATLASAPSHAHPLTGPGLTRSGPAGPRRAGAGPAEQGEAAPFSRVLQDAARQQAHDAAGRPPGHPAASVESGSTAGPAGKEESTLLAPGWPHPLATLEHPVPEDGERAAAARRPGHGRGPHPETDPARPSPRTARLASAAAAARPVAPADQAHTGSSAGSPGRAQGGTHGNTSAAAYGTGADSTAGRPGATTPAEGMAAAAPSDAAASPPPDPEQRTRMGLAAAPEGAPPQAAEPGAAAAPVATGLPAASAGAGTHFGARPLSSAQRTPEQAPDPAAGTGLPAPGRRSPPLAGQTPTQAAAQALPPGSGSVPGPQAATAPGALLSTASAPGDTEAAPVPPAAPVAAAALPGTLGGIPGTAPPLTAANTMSPPTVPDQAGAERLTGDAQAQEADTAQASARPVPQPPPATGDRAGTLARAGAGAADSGVAGMSAAVSAGTPASTKALTDAAAAAVPFSLAPGGGAVTAATPAAAPPEARLPVPPGHAAFAAAVGAQVALFVRDGVHTARLHLNPAELGPITVQIALEGASARVHLAAEHALTRQALEQAMPTLAGTLRDGGLTLTGGGVSDQPRDAQPQSGAAGDGTRRGPDASPFGSTTGPQGAEADDAISRARPWVTPRGIVDLVA